MRLFFLGFILMIVLSLSSTYGASLVDLFGKGKITASFEQFPIQIVDSCPDSILVDPENLNKVWISCPCIHYIISFDYTTKTFEEFASPDYSSQPDGIAIDASGNLWYGGYEGHTIGMLNIKTKRHRLINAEYENAKFAHTVIDNDNSVWISDHENNLLGHYFPTTNQWEYLRPPRPNSWIVEAEIDPDGNIWYSAFDNNALGVIYRDGKHDRLKESVCMERIRNKTFIPIELCYPFEEFVLPIADQFPGFISLDSHGNLWTGGWKGKSIFKFNRLEKTFSYWQVDKRAVDFGNVLAYAGFTVFVERSSNKLSFFKEDSGRFFRFDIPYKGLIQKDGLAIAENVVWALNTGGGQIIRMALE